MTEPRRVIIPYKPRPLQLVVHQERGPESLLITHRRFGKTVLLLTDQMKRALKFGNMRRAWRAGYLAPYLKQSKRLSWDYLRYYAGGIPGVKFNKTDLCCDFPNGARLTLYGGDNPEGLRGGYFDDLVIDEAADVSVSLWTLVLLPSLLDREGWVMFSGTPKGEGNLLSDIRDEAAAAPDQWRQFIFKASETGYLPESALAKARSKMTQDEYDQEFECSFAAAIRGAYYAREIDTLTSLGRIIPIPFERALPVHTAWDLGMSDATSIWFFQVEPGGDFRIIDYYENSGEGLEHYVYMLKNKGYTYGRHIAPPDIAVRELGTGKSRLEVAAKLGVRFTVARALPVIDGIQAVRRQLPRCWFDAQKCAEGLKGLRQYRKSYNEKADVYGKPVHDWTSHAADAFRYLVVGMMPERKGERQEQTINYRG
jgi:hypothetical protein